LFDLISQTNFFFFFSVRLFLELQFQTDKVRSPVRIQSPISISICWINHSLIAIQYQILTASIRFDDKVAKLRWKLEIDHSYINLIV